MTAGHAWSLFCSLPSPAKAALVLAAALLLVGTVVVSLAAGRAVAWVDGRVKRRPEPAGATPVDPFARVLSLPPHTLRREFQAIVEASAADAEGAR